MKASSEAVVVEQLMNTSRAKVWSAISNLEEMKQWYFDNIDAFMPEVGAKSHFKVQVEDRVYTHLWTVTDVIPGHKLRYNWKYEEYQGDSFVTFEIFENEGKISVRLTAEVTEDFEEGIPEFTRASCVGGWNYFIGLRLKDYLEAN
jgi:uncharacterized protein YndB with AHSA1/START domain